MIYVVLFLFLTSLSFLMWLKLPKDLDLIILLVTSLILILFAGLRGDIDPDYSNYLDVFKYSDSDYAYNSEIEIGYYFLNKAVLSLGLGFQFVIVMMAFFAVFIKLYFYYKNSPNYGLSVLIYFSTIFFLFDFIAIRQGLTLAIFMLSIPLIIQRNFVGYFLLMLLASQIHITAILLIPGYFIFNKTFSNISLVIIVTVCAFLNLINFKVQLVQYLLELVPIPGFTAVKLNIYLAATEYAFVSFKQILLAFVFIFLKGNNRNKHDARLINVLVNLFVFGILFATIFNGLPQFSYRMKWYFFWPESILVVYLIDTLAKGSLKLQYLLCAGTVIIYGYSLYGFLTEVSSRGEYVFPYKLFFE